MNVYIYIKRPKPQDTKHTPDAQDIYYFYHI